MTAVVVVAVTVVLGFAGWWWFNNNVRPQVEHAIDEFDAAMTEMQAEPGPCLDLNVSNGVVDGWTEIDCDNPHNLEVTYWATFDDGPFPGDDYLAERALATCSDAFAGYVGLSPDDSVYDVRWVVPSAASWGSGDRHGVCLAVSDEPMQETIKGSNR